tara:strand:+ start:1635 stop:3215 length:1581 start_codon:yes stop_codon:yes gene_type:complete
VNPLHFDFPKEVGLFRKVVNDNKEFEKYWRGLQNSQCAYMSVYGFRAVKPNGRRAEYNTAIIKHFVLDFDKKYRKGSNMIEVEGDEVVEQVKRLHYALLGADINHGVWFSGNGFHIWISLEKTHLPSSGTQVSHIKAAGKKVINEWKKDMELYCMDPTVPFDTARMIRVPNSYNAKQHVLRWSIPLKTEDLLKSWDEICEMAESPKNTAYFYGTKGVHLPVKEVRKKQFKVTGEPVNFDTVKMGSIKILPCLMEAACQVGSNPPHISRASLAIYLASRLRNFLPVQRTTYQMREAHILTLHDFIKSLQWADYDPGTTEYQLRSIVEGGYMERCESLIGKGLCIGRCQLWDGTGEHEDVKDDSLLLQVNEKDVYDAKKVLKEFDSQKMHDKFSSPTNYVGYLGEMIFNRHLESINKFNEKKWLEFVTPNWEDPDFILNGYSVDLKTTYDEGGMWFQEPKHDIYIAARISRNNKKMHVIGWIGKKELKNMQRASNPLCVKIKRGNRYDWKLNECALHDLNTLPFEVIK